MDGRRHDRSTQRGSASICQSRHFRQYESGNAIKAIPCTPHLHWSSDKTERAYAGHAVCGAQSVPRSLAENQPPSAPAPPAAMPASAGGTSSALRPASSGAISRSQDALWVAVGDREVHEVARLLGRQHDLPRPVGTA
jgi:hypothetical protein